MEQVKQVIGLLRPYDISASKLIQGFGLAGSIGAILIGCGIFVALKLRLLAKFGLYIGSFGVMFLGLGVALLYNTPLIMFGSCLILAGLVFVVGIEKTKIYYEIFKENTGSARAMARAAFVIFVAGFLAQIISKLPVINRLYKWIPLVNEIVECENDEDLAFLASSLPDEPEPEPWTTPGRLRSSRSSRKAD